MNKAVTGKLGELAAGRYLRENGYEIITANYRCRLGEIDIIAKQNKYICFVEVKTRSENYKYAPADAVTFSKRKKIIAAAKLYMRHTMLICNRDLMSLRCSLRKIRLQRLTLLQMLLTERENESY